MPPATSRAFLVPSGTIQPRPPGPSRLRGGARAHLGQTTGIVAHDGVPQLDGAGLGVDGSSSGAREAARTHRRVRRCSKLTGL